MAQANEFRVEAIRNNDLVGRNTCSVVDECYSDEDVIAELNDYQITTEVGAIKWAIEMETAHHEQALNCRFGSDDDDELKAYEDWKGELS